MYVIIFPDDNNFLARQVGIPDYNKRVTAARAAEMFSNAAAASAVAKKCEGRVAKLRTTNTRTH